MKTGAYVLEEGNLMSSFVIILFRVFRREHSLALYCQHDQWSDYNCGIHAGGHR